MGEEKRITNINENRDDAEEMFDQKKMSTATDDDIIMRKKQKREEKEGKVSANISTNGDVTSTIATTTTKDVFRNEDEKLLKEPLNLKNNTPTKSTYQKRPVYKQVKSRVKNNVSDAMNSSTNTGESLEN